MATRIDGKAVSAKVREEVREEVASLKEQGVCPGLAVVIVGDDPASRIYVNNKKKACQATGIYSEEYALPAETSQEELLALVDTLNHKHDIHGILVQSPLPKGLDEEAVVESQKRCGRFSCVQRGKNHDRRLSVFALHSCGNYGIAESVRYFCRRQTLCCHWTKQYCR